MMHGPVETISDAYDYGSIIDTSSSKNFVWEIGPMFEFSIQVRQVSDIGKPRAVILTRGLPRQTTEIFFRGGM